MHKPPLVLIPGLLCDDRLWAPLLPALAPIAACTTTDHHTRFDAIGPMVEAIALEAPPRFALAGLSMGGYIALEICRRFPERVERLALLDTSARPDTPPAGERRRRLMAMSRNGQFDEVVASLYPMLVHPDRLADTHLKGQITGMAHRIGPAVFIQQQRAIMGRIDQRPNLPAITCPTVVICGRQDSITPVDCAEEMAAGIPAASLRIIENCGHMSTMEASDTVGAVLREWLTAGG